MSIVAAVDIGATKTAVALVDTSAHRWTRPNAVRFATPREPSACVGAIRDAVADLAFAQSATLAALGVGAPGPLDAGEGIIDHSPNLGWRDVALASLLKEATGLPVALEDDAKLGGLGEWFWFHRDANPFVYVTVSTGIGAGIVADGALLRGRHGLAGEIGHLTIDPAGPLCGCGRRGCVEAFAGGNALGRLAAGLGVGSTAAELFAAAKAGDGRAVLVAAQARNALAQALAAVVSVVDPEVVCVAGSVADAQPELVQGAALDARNRVIGEIADGWRLEPARLGPDAVLAGAAILASELISKKAAAGNES